MTTSGDPHKLISVIVPVHNGTDTLAQCLSAVNASDYQHYECLVVDDGSTDGSAEVARRFAVNVIELEGEPSGPAHARNHGAEAARGEILLFIDADVMVRPDTLTQVMDSFNRRRHIAALFGSYDESPAGTGFLTQYKNLIHHYVHQQGRENAATFWSGCGAIQRDVFLKVGGFDEERYPQPSIEDIDLGYRLRAAGYQILLKKDIQVKHLKRWSLKGLIQTDVFGRALPWTRLIMEAKELPNDLNLHTSQRMSALLLFVLLLLLLLNVFQEKLVFLPLITALFLLLVNGWHWRREPLFFNMSRGVEMLTYLLIGVTGLLAYYHGVYGQMVTMGVLLIVVLSGRLGPQSNPTYQKALFFAMMTGLAAASAFVVINLPVSLIIPVVLILIAIVLLNRRLYLFFARKRGFIFALAVLPLQLFYYFYSVLVFIMGGGLHVWNSQLKPRLSWRFSL